MSDPYYTYDSFDIQINVFHVPEPLKGNLSENDKSLHQDAYLFSCKDKNKPDINFPKNNIKIIDEKIYLSDTNEILLQKITPILNSYVKENNISIVIDKKTTIDGSSEYDITKIVVEKLNNEFPSLNLQ